MGQKSFCTKLFPSGIFHVKLSLKKKNCQVMSFLIFTKFPEINIFFCLQFYFFFSSPDPKGHVSYCHHLASVVVVRRKLFQKSSPLKLLNQLKQNLVWIITRVSSFKIVSGDAVHQPTWPLLLKIEHMVKLQGR